MRVYVTGADGGLGTALCEALRTNPATAEWPVFGVSITDFDIGDSTAVRDSIDSFWPDVVLHLAAIAVVADCEADPAAALRVNVAGVRNVADACRRRGSRLVFISTDYVFDGEQPPPGGYRETDVPNPLSIYGLTKLAGERIASTVGDHLVVRTSWLFGGSDERTDDVLASVRQAQRAERTSLVCDQFSRPTYTVDLADAIVHLLTRDEVVAGTLHVANEGSASRYEIGLHAVRAFDPGLLLGSAPEQVGFDECSFVGARPRISTLNTDRLAGLGYSLPEWRDGINRFCARLRSPEPAGSAHRTLGD